MDANVAINLLEDVNDSVQEFNDFLRTNHEVIIELARLNLEKYDRKRKKYFDRNIKERRFEIGDYVMYYDGPIGNTPKPRGFFSRWKGPFRVINTFNQGVNLKLDNGKITNVNKCLKWNFRQALRLFRDLNRGDLDEKKDEILDENRFERMEQDSLQNFRRQGNQRQGQRTVMDTSPLVEHEAMNLDSVQQPNTESLAPTERFSNQEDVQNDELPSTEQFSSHNSAMIVDDEDQSDHKNEQPELKEEMVQVRETPKGFAEAIAREGSHHGSQYSVSQYSRLRTHGLKALARNHSEIADEKDVKKMIIASDATTIKLTTSTAPKSSEAQDDNGPKGPFALTEKNLQMLDELEEEASSTEVMEPSNPSGQLLFHFGRIPDYIEIKKGRESTAADLVKDWLIKKENVI